MGRRSRGRRVKAEATPANTNKVASRQPSPAPDDGTAEFFQSLAQQGYPRLNEPGQAINTTSPIPAHELEEHENAFAAQIEENGRIRGILEEQARVRDVIEQDRLRRTSLQPHGYRFGPGMIVADANYERLIDHLMHRQGLNRLDAIGSLDPRLFHDEGNQPGSRYQEPTHQQGQPYNFVNNELAGIHRGNSTATDAMRASRGLPFGNPGTDLIGRHHHHTATAANILFGPGLPGVVEPGSNAQHGIPGPVVAVPNLLPGPASIGAAMANYNPTVFRTQNVGRPTLQADIHGRAYVTGVDALAGAGGTTGYNGMPAANIRTSSNHMTTMGPPPVPTSRVATAGSTSTNNRKRNAPTQDGEGNKRKRARRGRRSGKAATSAAATTATARVGSNGNNINEQQNAAVQSEAPTSPVATTVPAPIVQRRTPAPKRKTVQKGPKE